MRTQPTSYTDVVSARSAGSSELSTVSTAVNTMTSLSFFKSRSDHPKGGSDGKTSGDVVAHNAVSKGTSMGKPYSTSRERQ
ncbi:hypothetical protein MIPYR_30224 [uncultured Microbacterium sp.]|uniref:Uncharacterized protein n=1 Tax=uncultured Microbacterium sp. TaxID=191216 RepID=A0A1Y5P5J0_9MICO|nr:hypothetical protein MIPYR_30224 [uncultured Microbacterium sp.]